MVASAKLTIRLTDAEARILRSQAIRNGLSLSAFSRQQILHGGSGPKEVEEIVSQILPILEARFDGLAEEIQAIKSAAQLTEDRATEKLKKAVQIIVEETRKK